MRVANQGAELKIYHYKVEQQWLRRTEADLLKKFMVIIIRTEKLYGLFLFNFGSYFILRNEF